MPTIYNTNFNIVVSLLGGWLSLFGLVSYLCKEKFYLSEALISLLAGVAFSPAAANWIQPLEYAGGSERSLEAITLYFSRLVLGVQLVLAGVQLPSRYLKNQWRELTLLVGLTMSLMWLTTSLIVWALVPNLPFLHALAVGSCVTPTDPVLSAVIVKGKFADHNVPKDLQNLVIAESGANDGFGYPFLFFALYLIKYIGDGGVAESGGARTAIGLWFGETWGYTILLSVAYGIVVGWLAKWALHLAEERKFVDRESFLVFAISLALFIVGTCGLIGSDDVLACFVAGNVFTWDDWFRLQTLDDSLQPTIDMLLNVTIFMWYGAVCPWDKFAHSDVIPLGRLVALGILVLLFRRLPWVWLLHKWIPQIEQTRQAVFVGFFGPIGVSAIFYLYITLEFIENDLTNADGKVRGDVQNLSEDAIVVVWFLTVCSIVCHGLSIPLGKLGYYLPRTMSTSRGGSSSRSNGGLITDDSDEPRPFHLSERISHLVMRRPNTRGRTDTSDREAHQPVEPSAIGAAARVADAVFPPRPVFRIGGSIIPAEGRKHTADGTAGRRSGEQLRPSSATPDAASSGSGETGSAGGDKGKGTSTTTAAAAGTGLPANATPARAPTVPTTPVRSIRFPDMEPPPTPRAPPLSESF